MESVRNEFFRINGGGKAMKDRTKVEISTALTTLLAKKAIADITVREIVELCEIRRQTFYYHFADIYALMDWTLEYRLGIYRKAHELPERDWKEELWQIFEFFMSVQPLIINAYNSENRRYYELFMERQSCPVVADLLQSNPGIANLSVEKQNFICRAYSRVFVGLFLDWVSNGMKAKDLDCFSDACILVEGGIEGALKKFKK